MTALEILKSDILNVSIVDANVIIQTDSDTLFLDLTKLSLVEAIYIRATYGKVL
jgi:hypothetical protein